MGYQMGGGNRARFNRMSEATPERSSKGRKADAQTLRRIAASFSPYKLQVVLVVVTILFTTVTGLINPLLIGVVFDQAINKGNGRLLIIIVSIMFVTPIVSGIVGVAQTYLNNIIGQSVMRDLRNTLYGHLQSMSLRFFTATRTGEIQSRLSNDIGGVQNVVTSTATTVLSNISTALSTIIAMLFLSPLLTAISLGLLPVFLYITYKVGNVRRTTSKETQKSLASLTAMMQETLSVSGILLTKTFGRQQYEQQQFATENQRLTNLEVRQQMIGRWFFMFIGTFFSIMPAVIYLVAGLQHINHMSDITVGTIVAFTTLQSRIYFPIGQLLNVQVEIQGALALFDRIFEYLDMPIDLQDKPDAFTFVPETARGEITFKDVSFTYKRDEPVVEAEVVSKKTKAADKKRDARKQADTSDKSDKSGRTLEIVTAGTDTGAASAVEEDRLTLHNISFSIEPGQLVALVGPSGAGKTTITYLVPRLYDVDDGSVQIDGHDVRDVTLESLGEMVGMVTQETYLFHDTIRANLLYARQDATQEELEAAAKAAAIHERIVDLSEGYDTVVGERGYKLSGGEKQRIAIARVILKNPRILILDEATSALDTHSERLIQAALDPLMKGRTTLAIAHRLSTILNADQILVLNRGEIVERGTHEELLARSGLYAQLYREQFSQRVEEESIA